MVFKVGLASPLIADAHAHVSPKGLGVRKVCERFRKVGGWFIALVSLPPSHYGLGMGVEDLEKALKIHVNLCREATESGVKTACIAGIHPSFIDRLVRMCKGNELKLKEVINYLEGIITKVLAGLLKNGLISGLGEFGRPHYTSIPESFALNTYLLIKALEVIRDYGGIIHLHLEQGGYLTAISISKLSDLVGVNRRNVLFHHASTPLAVSASQLGHPSTIVGRSESLRSIYIKCPQCSNWVMVESDYIDDLRRPGVVMYPWEIRDSVNRFLSDVGEYEAKSFIDKLMIDNIVKTYGVEPP